MCRFNRLKSLLLRLFKSQQISHFEVLYHLYRRPYKQKESYLSADKSMGTLDKIMANGSTYKFSHQVSAESFLGYFREQPMTCLLWSLNRFHHSLLHGFSLSLFLSILKVTLERRSPRTTFHLFDPEVEALDCTHGISLSSPRREIFFAGLNLKSL